MISKFMNLETEKQERILNAALKEFAQKGYKNASTNEIVKGAKISKGLLFHYFSSKKDLYLFLYDYSIDLILSEFYGKINYDERDIIKRWTEIAWLKLEITKKMPDLYDFLLSTINEDSADVKKEIDKRVNDNMKDGYRKIFAEFDTSLFKENINIKQAVDIITWTIQGFSNQMIEKMKSDPNCRGEYEKIIAEYDSYINLLEKCFYK